ncbi:amino acid adenylation domain-containing protein [Lysobacter enzymogenes]|uniref:amino acid adenylation domain-containing protein n=1 Tax=Lysobacter enzymogenes TaxID=69 RepID=UPI0038508620
MNLEQLLARLRELGVAVHVREGELSVRAPRGAMSPELLESLRAHKPALLAMAAADGDDVVGAAPAAAPRITPDMLPLVRLTQAQIDGIVERVPGGVANIQDIYPLAPLQEGILFHHLLGEGDGEQAGDTYLLRSLVAFESRDRLDAFLAALQQVIDRHDILRSAVQWQGLAQPVQVVHRRAPLPLREWSFGADENALDALSERTDPRRRRIDLQAAPNLAAHVAFDAASGEWLLALLNHHMVCDHVTMELILGEIHLLLQGQGELLPAPLPYRNFIARTRAVDEGAHEAYFRARLGDIDEATAPFGVLDVQGDGQAVEDARIELDDALARAIRDTARAHGVTPAVLFHLAWAQVLGQCCARADVVFGTVLSGRLHGAEATANVVGMFINTLPMRVSLRDQPVDEAVRDAYRALGELLAHEQASLALAQRCSGVRAPTPLFTTLLNYRHSHAESAEAEEETARVWAGMRRIGGEDRTNYPLTMSVNDRGEGFGLATLAVPGIDGPRMMAYLRTAVAALVDALANAPQRPLASLPILPAQEREQLLSGFGAARGDYRNGDTLHRLFEAQAARAPDAIALSFEDATLSYGELERRANRVAHRLIALGVRPGDRVALCIERGFELVVGVLAVLKAGAAYVPMDPAYPDDRLAYMIEDSAPSALVTSAALHAGRAALAAAALPVLRLDAAAQAAGEAAADASPAIATAPDALAYVIYTSGSTGRPKGVMVEHGHVARLFAATDAWFGFGDSDVWTLFHSFAFDFSVWEIWGALFHGGRLVVVPELCARVPSEFYALLARERVTVLNQTPSAFRALIAAQGASDEAHALRTVIFGGEALELHTLLPWIERNDCERTALVNMYGITEITVHATYRRLREADIRQARGSVIGCAIPDLRLYVLDANLQPAPAGVAGELYVGGHGVARGYLNRAGLTAERFLRDPFCGDADARLYKTGDLGRWLPDGDLEYLGRNDFQVKIRGFRIELGEIEAKLAACAGVREAVVIAREDAPGDKRLVAYVVAHAGADASAPALREALSRDLADYMVPGAFVVLDALPLTTNGKLDRNALPAPDQAAVSSRAFEPPQGATEQAIAEAWRALLGLERVGRHDHFFELGGHSLMLIGLIERLRQSGLGADVRSVFAAPVLSALAARIDAAAAAVESEVPANRIAADAAAIAPDDLPLVALTQAQIDGILARVPDGVGNVQDIYPLAPLQKGILFHHLLENRGEGDTYLLRSVVAFDSRERLDRFLSALQQVIDRHDILRSAVHWEGLPEPVQVVQRRAPLPVRELAPAAGEAALPRLLAHTDTHRNRLDLSRAPVMAAHIAFDAESGEWLLSLLTHHIVEDNYSKQLMLKEAEALLQGHGDSLPAPMPYRNFIGRTLAEPEQRHEAWFRELLGDVDEPTVPFGVIEVPADDARANESRVEFADALAARVRAAARQWGVTPSVLFHLAWARVLGQCSGRDDVVFGTVLSGRMAGSEGADQVVGMFLNTLPVRVPLAGRSVGEAVRATYGLLGDLLEREQVSLALTQQCSAIAPPLPLFTALLNYRNRREIRSADAADRDAAWEGMRLIGGDARNNYPLTMSIEDRGEGFGLTLLSVAGIDGPSVVRYMHTAMESLVAALEAGGDAPLPGLNILPAAERQQVLAEFNGWRGEHAHDRTIAQVFEAQAAATPDAEALLVEDEVLSYAELNRRANRVAHRLLELGVRPDDRVAICAERSVAMIVGVLGVLKAGAAYVPLDPAYPLDRLSYMLADSRPIALLTQTALRDAMPLLEGLALPVVTLDNGSLDLLPETNPASEAEASNLAYVIYTSGSTGQPKGVMVEHRSAVNFWRVMKETTHRELQDPSRVALNAAFSFDMSMKGILQLLSGHALVLIPQAIRANGPAMLEFIDRYRIDAFDSTPSQLEVLLQAGLLTKPAHRPTSVLLGGEPIGRAMWDKLKSADIHFFNMYGPTECTVDATIGSIRESEGGPTIGRPIMNTPVYLLDARGEPVPVGVPGELFLGGVQVARGYLDRPELTAERFLRDPFSPVEGARMYKTGDLGRWRADGTIEYLGRNDFQVKIRGFRIELGEIEAKLLACEGVREAAVIAREDVEGDKRLVAYVVGNEGADLSASTLREALSRELAEYMIPSAFVALDALPLNPNGKLDRKALPSPDQSAVARREFEAPVGEVEEAIARIWQELLGLERVGRHDHFFELGGHSLLIMQLAIRVREQFQVDVPLRELFEQPVLSALADTVKRLQLDVYIGEDLQEMQDELDGLSEQELRELLERESANG